MALCFSLSIGCGGAGKVQKSPVFPAGIQEMRYFQPICVKQKTASATAKIPSWFVVLAARRLDTVFTKSAEKYRISGKINEPGPREAKRIYTGINLAFREIDRTGNIRDIGIPAAIRSVLKKEQSRFAFAMLITPELRTYEETDPNSIIIAGKDAYTVTSATIRVLIFDLENNNIAFHRKLSKIRYTGNWRKFLDDSLSEIFSFSSF